MRILVCWPPQVPSYFNAGHHLVVFSVASYLRATPGTHVVAQDLGALNATWKDYADQLRQGEFDVVLVVNDFDVVEGTLRAASYARALLPDCTVATLGRLSHFVPDFFRRPEFDAVVESGDFEAGAAEVLRWAMCGTNEVQDARGVARRIGNDWVDPASRGEALDPEQWILPDVREIPYSAYDRLYARDANRFCGIPGRRELVVPVSRGCPHGCEFCDVTVIQGPRDRRLSVSRTVEYIRQSMSMGEFEYVSFYSAVFTADSKWMRDLCRSISLMGCLLPWKCTTTLSTLTDDLIREMANAGCVRISVGVETLDEDAWGVLPPVKRAQGLRLNAVADACAASGIELNCFVVLGMPNSSMGGTKKTMDALTALSVRPRPTLYTPYHKMRGSMSPSELSSFNRQIEPCCGLEYEDSLAGIYSILFGRANYLTDVDSRIPSHDGAVKCTRCDECGS